MDSIQLRDKVQVNEPGKARRHLIAGAVSTVVIRILAAMSHCSDLPVECRLPRILPETAPWYIRKLDMACGYACWLGSRPHDHRLCKTECGVVHARQVEYLKCCTRGPSPKETRVSSDAGLACAEKAAGAAVTQLRLHHDVLSSAT